MYQASKKFGDAIAGSNRKFNTRLLENEKVLVESVKNFTITSGAEEITIGSAVASYVQATIENKGIALSGKEVSLEIGVEVDGEMEYIPMGLYTIQNPKIESNKVTFTAYDRLASKCNGAYYSKLGYPVDAVDILAEISTMTGVAIDTSTLQRGIQISQRAIIEEGDYDEETEESEVITTYVNPFDGYTYKETIGFIAGLFGKFAVCGRTGNIEFRWYQDISYEIQSNIFYNDLQETEESFSIKRLTCDNSDQTLSSGSGATGISMQNPVMTQSILDGVYNTVQGLVFTPAALRFIGDMRLDIGDIATAVKNDSTKFTIPIISLTTSYDGGLMQTIASYGNTAEEDDSDTKGPITEMSERVEYELAFVKKLMVDNLTATNATIKNLSGDVLKFKTGEFETLKTDVANFKQTFTDDLQASNAKINTLESDHATFKEATATNLNATNARIANIEADYLKATDAKLTYATITNLNTTSAEITKLKTKDAEIDKLVATKATITDLNAAVGRVGVLESGYANLNTLVNGNLTSDNIQNLTLTSKNTTIENGMIKNAMIENLSFDKITGIDINTTNLTVHSSDGKSKWSDNTIQISDANRVRVQIGKDASNDYSMSVWDKNGNLIWDALGATEKTIQRKIIRDGIVADDANISGSKLDINSVIKEVNGSTTKLKSSTIVMNDKNQTLDIAFNEMETTVADNLSSAKLYADGKLSDAQKYALEQANSALSSAKSYADSAVDNLEIGGRNLLIGTKDFSSGVNRYTNNYDLSGLVNGFTVLKAKLPDGRQYYDPFTQNITYEPNTKYTLSFYAKADSTCKIGSFFYNIANDNRYFDGYTSTTLTTSWKRYSITWTTGNVARTANILPMRLQGTGSTWCYMYGLKFEKGNKATDWTPAPEDTQSQIDNITEITTSHTTSISTMQGQISSLISEDTTIKGNYDALLSRYNSTVETVNSMKTTIGEHTTILDSQNDSIVAVTTKANTIESNLVGTIQTVSEVKSNLSGTQERVTKVETSLSGLTTRVSATEAKYDNLEIGGRNLVLRSKDFTSGDDFWYINGNYRKSIDDDGFTVVSISRSGAGLEWNRIIPHAFIPVEEMHRGIIVSFDFMCDKVSELNRGCICALQAYNSGGGRIGWYESQDILSGTQCKLSAPLSDGKWIRVQVPFSEGDLKKTYGSSDAVAYTSVSLQLVSNGSIHFKKVKIEYGNKATDYTEAPEDIDQQITAAETIASQTADKFNWLVKSGTNSTDFELTDRTATLVASAINMNGLVTFSGLNADLQSTINNKTNVSYLNLSSGGNTQACWKIATIKISGNYTNQDIIIGVNHRANGYTECRIQFQNAGNPDPGLASFRQTGRPSKCWRIIKTATSTWELYLYKTESWDGGRVVKYINLYDSTSVSVTWSGENADLPSGTIATEQMIADQTTIDGGIITTGYISADRIAAGSITADKIATDAIKSRNYISSGGTQGSFLNLSDGSFTSPNLSWDSNGNLIATGANLSGKITATKGKIGSFNLDKSLYLSNNSPYYFSQFCAKKVYGLTNEGDIYIGSEGIYSYSWETGNMYIGDSGSIQADVSSSRGVCIENGEIHIYKSDYCKDYPTACDNKYGLVLAGGYVASANYSDGGSIDGFNFILSPNKFNINGKIYASNELQTGGNQVRIISGNIGCMLRNDSVDFYILRTNSGDPYGGWTDDRPFRINWASNDITCGHNLTANDLIANSWLYCSEVHSSGAVVIGADSESFYWAHGFQIARGTSWGGVCIGDDSHQLRLYGSSIWASHSISTSDENLKENFTTLDQYEDFYMNLNPIGFNYIGDYDGKKTHFGFGAHKTENILESEGYDANKFAVVTHRPLVQEDIEKRFGKDVEVDIETEYGVSYTEFIALNTHMIQKTRRELTKVKQEKADLEARLQAIEARLGL